MIVRSVGSKDKKRFMTSALGGCGADGDIQWPVLPQPLPLDGVGDGPWDDGVGV
jgi:hypothetical protein